MPTEPRFSLQELVEASGMPDRRIRYYMEQGLVQRARGRGRSAYYTREHLEQLARVVDLQSRGLSLDEIRDTLAAPTPAQSRASENWERLTIHPDLEVHIRAEAPESIRTLVARFEQLAAQWLGSEYVNDSQAQEWDQNSYEPRR